MPILAASSDSAQTSVAPSRPDRIDILADDLTGACDAGAAFLRAAYTVRVWFGSSVLFSAPESVQAFNSNSRSLSPSRAARVVSVAAAALGSSANSLFFKKIDSAARGPLAAEILAAHRARGTRAVLLAPAFPAAHRTVHNGTLEIDDAAGQHAQIALAGLFPAKIQPLIGLVRHPGELASVLHSGKTVLLCDSTTQADLEALVRAAEHLPGLLYVGSAGLAQALASLNLVRVPPALVPPALRTLLVAGSPHPVTKLQLETLERNRDDAVRVVHIRSRRHRVRILDAFNSFAPQALILIGGDTALLAVHALGAHSFILQGELAPGIPWGIVQGGSAQGCTVVTKSGGFGAPTALNDILAALRGPA